MVHSFIDTVFFKYFLKSLLYSKPHSKEYEIMDNIKKHFIDTDLHFMSDISTILENFNENEQDTLRRIFFNEMTTGRGKKVFKTNETRPFNLLRKNNVFKQLKLPFANYWIDGQMKYSIEEYQTHNPYMFFNSENIKNKYFLINTDKEWCVGAHTNSEDEDVLSSWNDLEAYKHNYFDIIISDRYCLKDEVGIKENIPNIIKNLSSNVDSIKNILIFVRTKEVVSKSLERAYRILREEFDKNNMQNVRIKIFESYKALHDRFIITNSFYLESGNSFDYFTPNGHKTKGTTSLKITPISKKNSKIISEQLNELLEIYGSDNTEQYGNISNGNLLNYYKTIS